MFFQAHGKPKRAETENFNKYARKDSKAHITYRSAWEGDYMQVLEDNPIVESWDYESLTIPYFCPVKNIERKYKPDFYVRYNVDGKIIEVVIEIKPFGHIRPGFINEEELNDRERKYYGKLKDAAKTNMAKFVFANTWCNDRGWKFLILTERGFLEIANGSDRAQFHGDHI